MRREACAWILCSCVAATASAQIGNPAGDSPKSPGPRESSRLTNTVDELFVQLVGSGGHAETDLGNTASKKAGAASVRQFGQQMVDDHGKAGKKLSRIASSAKLDAPDAVADPDHRVQQKHLQSLSGDEFDREYIRTQIADHQRTATLLQWEIGSGENADLKAFAAETLPTVMAHLESARAILDDLAMKKP